MPTGKTATQRGGGRPMFDPAVMKLLAEKFKAMKGGPSGDGEGHHPMPIFNPNLPVFETLTDPSGRGRKHFGSKNKYLTPSNDSGNKPSTGGGNSYYRPLSDSGGKPQVVTGLEPGGGLRAAFSDETRQMPPQESWAPWGWDPSGKGRKHYGAKKKQMAELNQRMELLKNGGYEQIGDGPGGMSPQTVVDYMKPGSGFPMFSAFSPAGRRGGF